MVSAAAERTDIAANAAMCRAFFGKLERHDVDGAFALMGDAPGAGWMDPRDESGPQSNHERRREALRWLLSVTTEGPKFTLVRSVAEGDLVSLQLSGRSTLANGKLYAQIYHMLFEMKGGRIHRVWEYCDAKAADGLFEGLTSLPNWTGKDA